MKKTIGILGIALFLVSLTSCYRDAICIRGNGGTITEQRTLDDFDKVEIDIAADVHILQDPNISEPQISIEAQENILDNIETYVRNNKLKVRFDRCVLSHRHIDIYLTVKDLNEIQLDGSGNITTDNTIEADFFKANLNGSGNFDLSVEANQMEIHVDGSGNFDLEGATEDLEVKINGSGDIHAFDLQTKSTLVRVNGSGDTEVNVSEYLEVHINGSGNVRYMGNPSTNISINGSGNVMKY